MTAALFCSKVIGAHRVPLRKNEEVHMSIFGRSALRRSSSRAKHKDRSAAHGKTLSRVLLQSAGYGQLRSNRARCNARRCGALRTSRRQTNRLDFFLRQLVRIAKVPGTNVQMGSRSRQNSLRPLDVAFRCRSRTLGEKIFTPKNYRRRIRWRSSGLGERGKTIRITDSDRVGDGTERRLVRLEREMERWCKGGASAFCRSLPAHCRSYARRRRRQFAMGVARQLVRRAGSEMERVRELLSRQKLLRLGWA